MFTKKKIKIKQNLCECFRRPAARSELSITCNTSFSLCFSSSSSVFFFQKPNGESFKSAHLHRAWSGAKLFPRLWKWAELLPGPVCPSCWLLKPLHVSLFVYLINAAKCSSVHLSESSCLGMIWVNPACMHYHWGEPLHVQIGRFRRGRVQFCLRFAHANVRARAKTRTQELAPFISAPRIVFGRTCARARGLFTCITDHVLAHCQWVAVLWRSAQHFLQYLFRFCSIFFFFCFTCMLLHLFWK